MLYYTDKSMQHGFAALLAEEGGREWVTAEESHPVLGTYWRKNYWIQLRL